jgi:four helix bundle protein
MKYEYFEDIPLWQQARQFVKKIYTICNHVTFKKDYDLISQIRRAGVSIMLNIAEGFERKTNKDFARFINNSKASSGEVRCALYIGLDVGYLTEDQFNLLLKEITSISKQLSKFEKYLLESDHKK